MNKIQITDFNQLAAYAEKLPSDLEWFNDNFKEWINERNIVDKSYFGGNYYDNYN